ncbi:MAG: DNA-processing protein DprA [Eubacterium sp.]|nr:DNA-processing protein DprA [Eubacterium sp.]
MADKIFWLWLMGLRGIGPKKKQCLLEAFGDPKALFDSDRGTLAASGLLKPQEIDKILGGRDLTKAREVLSFCRWEGAAFITPEEEVYPQGLRNLYTPPLGLFAKGELALLKTDCSIAVVGSRNATLSGRILARSFAKSLSAAGVTVVSGLAEGIDGEAHIGALEGPGATIAVMGTGIDRCYPAQNRALYLKIAQAGLLLTEFFPGERPQPYHFPQRNRIISGLADGLLVVEAREKSGAMITVDYALEQGKNVYALPGDILVSQKAGTNRLIKEGARMITAPQEILEDFAAKEGPPAEAQSRKPQTEAFIETLEDEDQRRCLKQIVQGCDTLDNLALVTGLDIRRVNVAVSMLELLGAVAVSRGKIVLVPGGIG